MCSLLGVLRDHGFTSLLLSAGLDQEMANMLVDRSRLLSQHYVCWNVYLVNYVRERCA